MADDHALEIGYNTRLTSALSAAAGLVAVLLWARALGGGSALDGVLAAAVSLIAVASAVIAVSSARSPLLVADRRGVRVKIGGEWCGFPWISISEYHVEPRRLPWTDGHLLIQVQHSSHVTESLSERSQRRVAASQRRHHAELSLPLGAITGVSRGDERQLAGRLAVLAALSDNPAE
jgi:hypothetical protein